MKQAKINDTGDLFLILSEDYDKEAIVTYQLDNGAEVEFIDDKCVAIVLPSFVSKLNRGSIETVTLESLDLIEDTAHFNLDIGGQVVNGRINFASLKDKI